MFIISPLHYRISTEGIVMETEDFTKLTDQPARERYTNSGYPSCQFFRMNPEKWPGLPPIFEINELGRSRYIRKITRPLYGSLFTS